MKTVVIALLSLSFTVGACDSSFDDIKSENERLTEQINVLPKEPLSEAEASALLFMREEEKLARDVYDYMYDTWGAKPFSNISVSEQKHMDAVLQLIDKYELNDPAGNNQPGIFVNTDLQQLYNALISQGEISLEQAFRVGAAIEEIDIIDLRVAAVDNQDIILVFDNLEKGSRNHIRAYVSNLENLNVTYLPQFMSQEDYDEIINSPMERGGNGRRRR
ncbi:MAG: DUF2202 domain-containing protein [Cytophagales bacterium]|nr:DUF2202 domain-containing protein [Cytophagales bacterium]